MARPTKYNPKVHVSLAEQLCNEGYTDAELAQRIGIAESTLNDWKLKFPEFSEAIKCGKNIADAQVEAALYKRACGYEVELVKTETDEAGAIIRTTTITKHSPPDVHACIFWLKNRMPKQWRNNPDGLDDSEDKLDKLIQVMEQAANAALHNSTG